MKIAILGDTHFGMRNDSLPFYDHHNKFYQEVFFPYLKEHDIDLVIQTGDLFDRRKFINFQILKKAKDDFFSWFEKNGVHLITYLGNHDIYYRGTLAVNSAELLLTDYMASIDVVTKPSTETFDGVDVDIIPWICAENEQEIKDFIANSKSHICFGHFELAGFEMDRNNVCHDGMDRSELDKYEIVFSGHFHHRSTDGHILYVGSPGEMTFADVDDTRGFHTFDTESRLVQFVPNPFRMFHKIKYDDKNEFTFEYMKTINFDQYTGCYVKVVVINKVNPYLFEAFMDNLFKSNALDISIAEDYTMDSNVSDEDVESSEDTPTILKRYIEGLEGIDVDKNILYNKLHDLYIEAQTLEQI